MLAPICGMICIVNESARQNWTPYLLLAGVVFLFALFTAALLSEPVSDHRPGPDFGLSDDPRVGLIEIIGPITESRPVIDGLKKLEQDKRTKAVVVRIDSPGGAVGPSQEIYHALLDLRDKKPVVVSMGSVAASGGFYIASAATEILANAGTLTGSIGVIMAFADVSELLDWAKVRMEVVKTGQFKDTGSGYRPMTDVERGYLQDLIDEVLDQFVRDVATARSEHVTEQRVRELADGRVFTGARAVEYGLADRIGGYAAAVSLAGELGGIEGEPDVWKPRLGPPWYERVLEDGFAAPAREAAARLVPLWAVWVP